MLGRIATYVVPSLAVAITAAVLLGPGSSRKAAFVRVYGTPLTETSTFALRITGAERWYGIDETVSLSGITLEATAPGTTSDSVRVTLGPDGVGEALITFTKPVTEPFFFRARQGLHVLGEGLVEVFPIEHFNWHHIAPMDLPGQTSGMLKMSVDVRRGSMAAPFSEELGVSVRLEQPLPASPTSHPFKGIKIYASASGATVVPEKFFTDENGHASFAITPQVHHVDLTLEAQDILLGEGKWEGTMPVIPGAIWMQPETKDGLVFVSPVPRERVYVSVMGKNGRIFGAVVPVSLDEQKFYRGRLELPDAVKKDAWHVVVAGDAEEQGAGTVTWPIGRGGTSGLGEGSLVRLLDGGQAAEEHERGRASRARRLALLVVIATAIFEVLFMISKSRRAQRELEEKLVGFVEGEPVVGEPDARVERAHLLATARQENPVLRVALAISLVLVAFSMIGALAALQ